MIDGSEAGPSSPDALRFITFRVNGRIEFDGGMDDTSAAATLNDQADDIEAAIEEDAKSAINTARSIRAEIGFTAGSVVITGMVIVALAGDVLRAAAVEGLGELLTVIVKRQLRTVIPRHRLALTVRRESGGAEGLLRRLSPFASSSRTMALLLTLIAAGVGYDDIEVTQLATQHADQSPAPMPAASRTNTPAPPPLPSSAQPHAPANLTNLELYLAAIRRAAVRSPMPPVTLTPIDDQRADVTVITIKDSSRAPKQKLDDYTWVAIPADLQAACRGKPDPVLALEQILGLPPYRSEIERANQTLYRLSVDPKQIFRPCLSAAAVTTRHCDAEADIAGAALDTEVKDFMLQQIWTTYRIGFNGIGHPFTGMGWTYDWNPDSQDHIGVSEYVVRKGTTLLAEAMPIAPAEFCSSTR
jgi:hypothetical protein